MNESQKYNDEPKKWARHKKVEWSGIKQNGVEWNDIGNLKVPDCKSKCYFMKLRIQF